MTINIITLFPETVDNALDYSIIGRAKAKGTVNINAVQLRDYTWHKQKQTDDYPYGGGGGMVLYAQPLLSAWADIRAKAGFGHIHTILTSPRGHKFTQEDAKRLAKLERFIIVCGHYEGVDERFIEACVDEQISIGDFVVTGGEMPAVLIADATARLIPGVLASEDSFTHESHWDGYLEHPHYTRPEVWEGRRVPPVLLSGNHKAIAKWRSDNSVSVDSV
ncbi:MAG: tRNA (guanosine(37)-N1)-methyltransferase TrmD [Oscillospiraceae bacterium]|jgi:tRNA (guanine37-N1)-methyltransferase|nr:tRNA (guanosine(37)-N1)-methyltransferase TrmD [Oscillospiraceae bacterium]